MSISKIIFIFSIVFLYGCTSHKFIPTGMIDHKVVNQNKNCEAKLLLKQPSLEYVELGICMAQVPGGGVISDNTSDALIELKKCACLNGGDAVIYGSSNEAGFMPAFGGYSQQIAKVQGIVIQFKSSTNK